MLFVRRAKRSVTAHIHIRSVKANYSFGAMIAKTKGDFISHFDLQPSIYLIFFFFFKLVLIKVINEPEPIPDDFGQRAFVGRSGIPGENLYKHGDDKQTLRKNK